MTNKKPTQKDCYLAIKTILMERGAESYLIDFIDGRITLLNKKNDNKSPSKNQLENEIYKNQLLNIFKGNNKSYSVSELQELTGLSNQKITALLTQMLNNINGLTREVIKKKAYYQLVDKEIE